jgi:hypothetical protein
MGFASDLNKLCARAGDKAEQVVRKSAIELQNAMIAKSPVDTGRFRANWQCGIGAINPSITQPPGSDVQGRTALTLEAWKPGQTIWLTNSLPYSQRLENGYSKQAPVGMVKLSVQEYGQFLKKAARSIK